MIIIKHLLWDFNIPTDQLISDRRPDLIITNNKKRYFGTLSTLLSQLTTEKMKECEKKNKYFDLAKGLKKLWNMKVTIIRILIGAFGTVTIGFLKELEDLD